MIDIYIQSFIHNMSHIHTHPHAGCAVKYQEWLRALVRAALIVYGPNEKKKDILPCSKSAELLLPPPPKHSQLPLPGLVLYSYFTTPTYYSTTC